MENEKKQKEYNIGLDIGTTSIGWAVTDENFKIVRKGNKRKALWGVLLFDEAVTAESRRNARSIRRRYARRRERINLLQEMFKNEIMKIDSNFYTKLNEFFYRDDDIDNKTKPLTKEEKEQLKLYQNKYPTIYHLRQKLLTNPEKEDIRLVYLAIHHIIKYRGNFNYNIENFQVENINIKEMLGNLLNLIIESIDNIYNVIEPSVDLIDLAEVEKVLLSEDKRESKKKLELLFQTIFSKKASTELANALIGYTINLENLFLVELEETKKIDFKTADFDEKILKLESELGDNIEIVSELKKLYDAIELKIIFKDENNCSISNLMVKYYEMHKKDLHLLKDLLRPYRNYYNNLFKNRNKNGKEELCYYTKYTRNQLNYGDFSNELRKILENVKNLENEKIIESIIEKLNKQIFLPRITDTSNGKYPYQINEAELKIIVKNQGKYYPFLTEEIKGEIKLVKLLKFRIPYYIGPLVSKEKSTFAWMERKKEGKITPFNFEEMVDKRLSAKNFILRMIGHCTYLLDEYSMPTNSILYSRFKVLNELKQIKINDHSLTENLTFLKQIYEEFFLRNSGNLTNSKFLNYLKSKPELSMYSNFEDDIKVTGYSADNKFANTMASYLDFFGPNGIFENTDYTEKDADEIIKLITIFEDKEILKEEILESYPNLLPKINKIITKKYKGWSGLSEKLLVTKYYYDEETNIKKSIMDLMWDTRENFMQILNNPKYGFWNMINAENQHNDTVLSYDFVSELATSPAVKKGIWQSLKLIKEIITYMGYEPTNITIEMARSNEKKGRIDDRKKQLQNIYEKFKSEINDYNFLMTNLKLKEKIDTEKLFLYFLQEGKSLYSMTPLDINNLVNYEVDHILPQTLIKDDSIDNKALVLKEENQAKRDNLVLPLNYRNEAMKKWWAHLRKINLLSNKKYQNLIRDNFRDKDIEGFINRQLVETRQITKHVANIIKNLYKNTNVIYLKANVSHNYRERFKLYKYRELNDYHHAHDAYLASVLGIYQNKYLKTKINKFELKELISTLIKEKRYDELKYGYVINSIDQDFMKINNETGEVALNVKDFTTTIEKTLYRNDILVTKKTEIKTGEFYNQTKNKKGMAGVPLKKNLKTEWYGSYTSLNPAYAVVVGYQDKKKNYNKRLIGIPIYFVAKDNKNDIENYIKNLLKINSDTQIDIIKDKIPFYSILNLDGQLCSLVGATDKVEVCNAKEFNLEADKQIEWKYTLNRLFNEKTKGIDNIIYDRQLNELLLYVIHKMETEYNLYFNLIPELKIYINTETINNMEIETKEKTLKELFKLLKFNSSCANLKILNEDASNSFGRKKSLNIKNAIIIKKSITGLKEYHDEF